MRVARREARRRALPRVLAQPRAAAPAARRVVYEQERRALRLAALRESQRGVELEMIRQAVQGQEALACKNEEYLQLNGAALRATRTMGMTGNIYRRFLEVQPNRIVIRTSMGELRERLLQEQDNIVNLRQTMGLGKRIQSNTISLFADINVKNCGTEAAQVRLAHAEGSLVRGIVFPQLRPGGLAPGLTYRASIELRVDLDRISGTVYDAVVLRTQEEVLCIPLTLEIIEEEALQGEEELGEELPEDYPGA